MTVVKDIKCDPNSCTELFSTLGETMNYPRLCIQSKIMKTALNVDEAYRETSLILSRLYRHNKAFDVFGSRVSIIKD